MNFRRILGYAAPYRAALLLAAMLMLLDTALALAIPWLAGQFAAGVLVGAAPSAASADTPSLLLALLGLFLAQAVLKISSAYVTGLTSARVLADLRVRIYDHLQALPMTFHHQHRQGDMLALVTHEVGQLSAYITGTLLSIPALLLTVAGAVIVMLRIDQTLAVVVAVLVPAFFLALKILGRRLRPLAQEVQEANASTIAIAGENLNMLAAIKTFTREAVESGRFAGQVEQMRRLGVRELKIFAAFLPTVQFLSATAVVLVLWIASDRIAHAGMTPAQLVSFLLYAALIMRPVSELAGIYGKTLMAQGTLTRLQDVLTQEPEGIAQMGHPLPRVRGTIEFREVRFGYPGRPPTLNGLDLHIAAGETLALTGENGAGKSTLAHLLMRLHSPDSGRILVDGVDIATVSLHSLRSQIGIVPQRVLLFNGSVRDNIAYGLQGAHTDAIEEAARVAQADDFIRRLPHGYDTVIGDHGIRLSGGQRQRLALARALLKDPPILILDEATAMFDPAGERSFIADCHQTLSRRTVILITHRPASLALADRIVRIEGGRATALLPQAVAA